MNSIILQKYIRDNLGISRRDAEDLINKRLVMVNNVIADPGQLIDPTVDKIKVKGKEIANKDQPLIYIALNKPADYITSRGDPHGRKTVYDLLPKEFSYLVPVGRLDFESEGLLIMTNDGDLTYRLTHPKFEVAKEYHVELDKELSPTDKATIEEGIKTDKFETSPCEIKIDRSDPKRFNITIHEGQNREIRKIFGRFGYFVLYLKRLRIGSLGLGDLQLGNWQYIDPLVFSN